MLPSFHVSHDYRQPDMLSSPEDDSLVAIKVVGGCMETRRVLSVIGLLLLACGVAFGARQDKEYSDPAGRYRITLIGDWRAVSYSDAVGRQKTEFIYKDRSEGLLKITRESLGKSSLSDFVHQEEENLRIYRAGYDRASSEPFGGGSLRGLRLSFYSTDGGRQMAGTNYYLQEGDSVWVLRFIGRRGSLDLNRNISDQIARSFTPR
jgi:hypothetical protein